MSNDESARPSVAGMEALQYEFLETADECEYAVIWLHGLGADGRDFVSIVPQLNLDHGRGFRFVFPHAPVIPVTINGGMRMRAWYDICSLSMNRDQDLERIRSSALQIEALIQDELNRGIPAIKILLAGFSQGGALALYIGLRYPHRLAGICVLSGYQLLGDKLDAERSDANRNTPVFMAHGNQDPVVPIAAGESSAAQLRKLHYPVTWQTYNMQHNICMDEIQAVSAWIKEISENA